MKVQPLLNQSEAKALRIADAVLGRPKYRVFPKVRLAECLAPEIDELAYADREFLLRAHLDFVVMGAQTKMPLFAIEFDGPSHRASDQIRRDIRKNRLCFLARLPLMRISPTHIDEHDDLSLLEFMLRRYDVWPTERARIDQEIGEYVSNLTEEELAPLVEGGVLDPSIDSSFLFDLNNPFPGIRRVSDRLRSRFGILSEHMSTDVPGLNLRCSTFICETRPYPKWTATCAYSLFRGENRGWGGKGRFHIASGEVLYEGTVKFGMQWGLRIADDWNPEETPAVYFSRTGRFPEWIGNEPPGMHLPSIVNWFAEYLALRRIEVWAGLHLPDRTVTRHIALIN